MKQNKMNEAMQNIGYNENEVTLIRDEESRLVKCCMISSKCFINSLLLLIIIFVLITILFEDAEILKIVKNIWSNFSNTTNNGN